MKNIIDEHGENNSMTATSHVPAPVPARVLKPKNEWMKLTDYPVARDDPEGGQLVIALLVLLPT